MALWCIFGTAAQEARAGSLSVKVVVAGYKPQTEPIRKGYWEVQNGFAPIGRDRLDAGRELAVVLVGKAGRASGSIASAAFEGGSLLPATLVVRTGTTLRIANRDEVAHELLAEGLDGFSAEATSPGAERTVRLTKAGNWPLRDRLIVHVRGHLHVLPNLVAVARYRDGKFEFPDLPAGKYELKILHGAHEVARKRVVVDAKGGQTKTITLKSPKRKPKS